MNTTDILYRIAVWDTHRHRREREDHDFLAAADARIQRGVAEAWQRGELRGPR